MVLHKYLVTWLLIVYLIEKLSPFQGQFCLLLLTGRIAFYQTPV